MGKANLIGLVLTIIYINDRCQLQYYIAFKTFKGKEMHYRRI